MVKSLTCCSAHLCLEVLGDDGYDTLKRDKPLSRRTLQIQRSFRILWAYLMVNVNARSASWLDLLPQHVLQRNFGDLQPVYGEVEPSSCEHGI